MPDQVRAALRENTPMSLLQMASAFVELCTQRPNDVLRADGKRDFDDVVSMFEASEQPELVLLGRTMSMLVGRGDLSDRPPLHGEPAWLGHVDRWVVTATGAMTDEVDDGENVFIGIAWPDGASATIVLYVDHNMGTLVKDAFVLPLSYDEVMSQYRTIIEQGQQLTEVSPADARARVAEALVQNDRTLPPIETDSWPACRPLAEWVLRGLPSGGDGFAVEVWTDEQLHALAADVAGAADGAVAGLTPSEVHDVLVPLLRLASGAAHGDPLRWSSVSVEVALLGSPSLLAAVPAPLRARVPDVVEMLVRSAHTRRGVSAEATMLALASLAQWTPAFEAAVGA